MTDDYRHFIEVLSDPTLIVKGNGGILAANAPASRLFGGDDASFSGRFLQDLAVEAREDVMQYLHNCARSRQPHIAALTLRPGKLEKVFVLKGGVVSPSVDKASALLLVQLFPRFEENIRFTELNKRIGELHREIQRRKQTEDSLQVQTQKLEQSNRRINEFLIMLAHELRNPLAPISNAVEILQVQHDLPAHSERARDILARQVRHLARMIDDFLDISRILRGKNIIRPETVNLTHLVKTICEDNDSQFSHSGQRLIISLAAEPVWLQADPTRVTQVLVNLLANANKYTPAGGRVEVSLDVEGEFAILTVADTGVGIDAALLPELFEPFTQSEQSLARSSGGLGLGLSIVKGLVSLHGGTVTAVSPGKGAGATFTVMLPLNADAAREHRGGGGARKILIIEDNPDTAETMGMLLGVLGYEVHTAGTGTEGLLKAQHIRPDVVICDIGLPEMDGFTVAEKLRGNPETAAIPLIALSGYGNENFAERARAVGFNLHLTKPARIEVIQEAINSL